MLINEYRQYKCHTIMTILDTATTHLENSNIPSTNNKIENIFQKVFPKHIKRTMKIEQGL